MIRQFSPTVEQLIRDQMASGKYASEDELLLDALQFLEAEQKDLAAIQEGLDWFAAGNAGATVDETFEKLRHKHNLQG